MKVVLYFGLIALLVPTWLTLFRMPTLASLQRGTVAGPVAALDSALREAGGQQQVSSVTRVTSAAAPDVWRLEGVASTAAPGGVETRRHFTADLRTSCRPLVDAACWVVERLDLPPVGAANGATATGTDGSDAPTPSPVEVLEIVQGQLQSIGFDPGPSDGFMGAKTRDSLESYAVVNGAGTLEDPIEWAKRELEASGRRASAARARDAGDDRAALYEYDRLIELDPRSVDAHYNRGLILDRLGLTGLALDAYDTALNLWEGDAAAYRKRGDARLRVGDYRGALSDHAAGLTRDLGMAMQAAREMLASFTDDPA